MQAYQVLNHFEADLAVFYFDLLFFVFDLLNLYQMFENLTTLMITYQLLLRKQSVQVQTTSVSTPKAFWVVLHACFHFNNQIAEALVKEDFKKPYFIETCISSLT